MTPADCQSITDLCRVQDIRFTTACSNRRCVPETHDWSISMNSLVGMHRPFQPQPAATGQELACLKIKAD
ncbi:MAG: hypothetical protein GY873_07370 [Bosea sp.]|uniref:hypothetical protein n=1 Tax=Bosea sp. (in: a-proteobacteria) TaxID=1871050 RepID=UPI0023862302|nr:hypothetical protein [Bosea sp. (in: a-proteobacteria)]MCP4733999.1 hypothetical protein [Bosea sp. (in: a-proteobacteria)]